jgi:hypothetical protein
VNSKTPSIVVINVHNKYDSKYTMLELWPVRCGSFCARMRRKATMWLQEEEYSEWVTGLYWIYVRSRDLCKGLSKGCLQWDFTVTGWRMLLGGYHKSRLCFIYFISSKLHTTTRLQNSLSTDRVPMSVVKKYILSIHTNSAHAVRAFPILAPRPAPRPALFHVWSRAASRLEPYSGTMDPMGEP